jgi:hypothetical protein
MTTPTLHGLDYEMAVSCAMAIAEHGLVLSEAERAALLLAVRQDIARRSAEAEAAKV